MILEDLLAQFKNLANFLVRTRSVIKEIYYKCKYCKNNYSGTPLIRPPSGRGKLVVLTSWSY